MKDERLDHILLRLGFVTPEQVEQAALRQKSRHGRFGSHLLYFKSITEDQLVTALSDQYGLPGFDPGDHEISEEALKKIPVHIAEEHEVFAINHDAVTGSVSIAITDPSNEDAIKMVQSLFNAPRVNLYIASETMIKRLILEWYYGTSVGEPIQITELPDFESEADDADIDPVGEGQDSAAGPTKGHVLMVTSSTSLRGYLTPVFEQEGYRLEVLENADDIQHAMRDTTFDQILVSQDKVSEFSSWLKSGKVPPLHGEFHAFSTVCDTLLENPVPYHRIGHSLFRSLHIVAETRCGSGVRVPPYNLLAADIARLAGAFGFRRLAADGMQVASYLLIPERPDKPWLRFADFEHSVALAKLINFPWNVQGVLQSLADLLEHTKGPAAVVSNDKLSLAAQIVAIVWYRHVTLRQTSNASEPRRALSEHAGKLWSTDVVQTYLQFLDADDDIAYPLDFNITTARVRKSLEGTPRQNPGVDRPSGFSASLIVLSFIELVQALSQSLKSVRIQIRGPRGRTGTVYLKKGKMVHAVCGRETGEGAVHKIIRWGEDGEFTVEPTDQFPGSNISESNESILMEGCRLLDESRV